MPEYKRIRKFMTLRRVSKARQDESRMKDELESLRTESLKQSDQVSQLSDLNNGLTEQLNNLRSEYTKLSQEKQELEKLYNQLFEEKQDVQVQPSISGQIKSSSGWDECEQDIALEEATTGVTESKPSSARVEADSLSSALQDSAFYRSVMSKLFELRDAFRKRRFNALRGDEPSQEILQNEPVQSDTELSDMLDVLCNDIISQRITVVNSNGTNPLIGSSVSSHDYEILQMHNNDLQAQLQQLSTEFEMLRDRCQRLHGNGRAGSPAYSDYSATSTRFGIYSTCHIHESMEYEYLKNVLSEYMCGKETNVLARVICTIMKFSSEQVKSIVHYEESRHSKANWPLSIIGQ